MINAKKKNVNQLRQTTILLHLYIDFILLLQMNYRKNLLTAMALWSQSCLSSEQISRILFRLSSRSLDE